MQEVIRVVTCTEFGVLFPFPQKCEWYTDWLTSGFTSRHFRLPDVFFYQIIGRTHGTLLEVTALWRLTQHYCLLYALTGTGKTVRFDIGGPARTDKPCYSSVFQYPGCQEKFNSEKFFGSHQLAHASQPAARLDLSKIQTGSRLKIPRARKVVNSKSALFILL